MENIKFIKQITDYIDRERIIAGNSIYYKLKNNNRAKTWCEEDGVRIKIINCKEGEVDHAFFPCQNYFEPTQCSPGAPKWYQHIEGNRWYFEKSYTHVLPKESDYMRLAAAMENYIEMFEEV